MYEKVEVCPICKGTEFANEIICTDHTVSKESFAIVSCKSCNLWITSPRPTATKIGKYYQSDAYISHTNKANNPINVLYKIVRSITLKQKTNLLKKYKPKGKVLDYGCGTGDFLLACKKSGFSISGIEPDESARKQAAEKNKIRINANIKEHEKSDKVDIITLWHVLEHVPDPNDIIKKLKKRLNKDGILIIAVPNRESLDAKLYNEYWAAYDVPRHLFHFNKLNIKKLARNRNLKVKEIVPQNFDAFYVSMLSEKYSKGGSGLVNGLINGLKSNQWAKKNDKNYSSLIYILSR